MYYKVELSVVRLGVCLLEGISFVVNVEPIGTYPAEMFSFAYLISLVGSFRHAVLKGEDKREPWRNHYIPLLIGKSHLSIPVHDAPHSLANIVIAVVVLIYAIRE